MSGKRSRKRRGQGSTARRSPRPDSARRPTANGTDGPAGATPEGAARPTGADSPAEADGARPPRLRGEERDALVRADLTELAPDERPVPLLIAVAVASLLGLANLVLLASGWSPADQDQSAFGGILFAAIMGAMAVGLWAKRYWALLGMQVLLALVVVATFLSLLVASNLAAVALCLGAALPSGWLFWKLVRVMARVQMPRRPDRAT